MLQHGKTYYSESLSTITQAKTKALPLLSITQPQLCRAWPSSAPARFILFVFATVKTNWAKTARLIPIKPKQSLDKYEGARIKVGPEQRKLNLMIKYKMKK